MNDYTQRAIEQFHTSKPRGPQPGDIIAHRSDPYTYEVREVADGVVTGSYIDDQDQEHMKQFPADEVFNPGAVKKIAQQLEADDEEGALRPSRGPILVDSELYDL